MISDSPGKRLYLVAVRYGGRITEHVEGTDCADLRAAMDLAKLLREWLSQGTGGHYLPAGAAAVRGELVDAGYDPRRGVEVVVIRLEPAKRTPAGVLRWNLDGKVLVTVADAPRYECDEDCDDTPLMPALPRVRVLR